jgi:Ni,Fe-hydrogenase I large subunit
VAHLLAQLIDLALRLNHHVAASGTLQSATLADGSGLGTAATARGLLLHQAHVAAGRVVHYRIVAPTEWNFHPDGALPRGLRGRAVADAAAARRDAQLLAQALDPCVACTVEVVDA